MNYTCSSSQPSGVDPGFFKRGGGLRTVRVKCRLWTAECRLQTSVDCNLQTANRRLWTRSKIQTKGKMQTSADHE